jgi:hypothetical protein
MVEGVAVGMRTVPVEELEHRASAVFNGCSLLIRISELSPLEPGHVTSEQVRLARQVSGELAWVHEWLRELIREHQEWAESLTE